MSQYGGPGRPTGSGDYGPGGSGGSGGGGDDDRYTSPFGEQGGQDPYEDDRPPFGYQEEERYWTDYLRIAAPVVGVILMLALVWFWVANMLNGDEDEGFGNDGGDEAGPVIDADTPETTEQASDDEAVAVTTPEDEEGDAGEGEGEGTPSATTLGPGAAAVVVGTGEEGLNVRAEPSTEADVVGSIADGTELTITGESEQADGFTWWPIDSGELTGFVAEDFIELSE